MSDKLPLPPERWNEAYQRNLNAVLERSLAVLTALRSLPAFFRLSTAQLGVVIAGVEAMRVDGSATATHTRLMVYDVDNGQIERVTVGAAGSGGVGFKVLRIPN